MRGARGAAAVIALLCLAVGLAGARTVDIAGARIETTIQGKIECVPLSAVAAALNGRFWRVDDRFVMVLPGDSTQPGREYVLRADSIHALCDGRRVELPAAPVLGSNRLYLPVVALADLFPSTRVPELQSLETARQGDTAVFTFRVSAARVRSLRVSGIRGRASSTGWSSVPGGTPGSVRRWRFSP